MYGIIAYDGGEFLRGLIEISRCMNSIETVGKTQRNSESWNKGQMKRDVRHETVELVGTRYRMAALYAVNPVMQCLHRQ